MEKKGHVGHRCRSGRWGGVFLSAILLAAGLAFPDAGRAASSGPGVWDFMIYGNYDLVSPNSGAAVSNEPAGTTSPAWNNSILRSRCR